MFFPSSGNKESLWPAGIPRAAGQPVRIEFRRTIVDEAGKPAHAATFLRQRRMVLEEALMADADDFARIFVHELFHFVWLRLGNAKRKSYGGVIADELRRGVQGELGWSAEWRKNKLEALDRKAGRRRWREYCCESFCDTAAWRYAGVKKHGEFTLEPRARKVRGEWFARAGVDGGIAI